MSEDLNAKLLARIAAMESELATFRAKRAEAAPVDHSKELATSLARDPVGTMTRLGIPVDHTTKILVAHALGDAAPPELKMLAAMGPQVSATNALASDLQAMRQRLEGFEAKAARESAKALASDKSKYPHLAKALAADPSLFEDELAKGTSVEDLEARVARVAKVYSPPASEADADTQQAESTNGKQAQAEVPLDPTPPPIAKKAAGVFTPEDHVSLRDEIVRKFAPRKE